MKLREQWNTRAWPRVLLAFLINAAFLFVMLRYFYPQWETNDDLLISKFVDGQLSRKTAYVPFVNICLGWLLKTVYTALGDGFNWYAALQYLVLFLGFTAVTWSLLRRFRLFPALVMTVVILGAFGTDCYLSMNFSKPAALGTVGGMCLMLTAGSDGGKRKAAALLPGLTLAAAGFCWRYEEFGICALLMAAGCIPALFEPAGDRGLAGRIGGWLRYLAPFVLLAAITLGLFAFNSFMWKRPEIRAYTDFDWTRSEFVDFGPTDYATLGETYEELDIDENFAYLIGKWSFYDTEKFTQENLERLIEARRGLAIRKTPGECLGVFLNTCLMGFTQDRPFAGFAFLLVLWLACGKRQAGAWVTLFCMGGLFGAIYLYLIYYDRYLANRVDIGLFLAMAVVLSFLLDGERLRQEKLLLTALLCLSLFVTYRGSRACCLLDSHNSIEDKSAEKAAVETLLQDTEHLYFVKVFSIDHQLYTPLETPPAGYADRLVHIGGWSMHHPAIERILREWKVENPYRDLADREDLRLIDGDISRTIAYLRTAYYPKASAELVEPLSRETGFRIYEISS